MSDNENSKRDWIKEGREDALGHRKPVSAWPQYMKGYLEGLEERMNDIERLFGGGRKEG